MQYLKRLGRLALVAGGFLGATAAWADGTDAGEIVVNSVTMTYTVGSTGQTATDSVDFTVDRKLRLDVSTPDLDWVVAVPGQVATDNPGAISFDITNNSNDGVNVIFGLVDQSNTQVTGFTANGGAPAFTVNGLTVWEDLDSNGLLDGAEVALVPTNNVYDLGTRAEDAVVRVAVVVDVDGAAADDEYHTYTLVAAVADGSSVVYGNDDSNNISPSGTAANNANGEDTEEMVFADSDASEAEDYGFDFIVAVPTTTGIGDGLSDGQHSNSSGFVTEVALGVAKYVEVIWDPISDDLYTGTGNGLTGNNPKAIPGALIMYVIGISIEAGSPLTATSVAISDDIDETMVAVGNTGNDATIALPDTVTMTIDGSPVVFDIDEAGIAADKDSIYSQLCSDAALSSTDPFVASPGPEVASISLGDCDSTDSTGYVVYFVTVDDTATP